MGGGAEVDGFALETEVGLFAMKREQVYRAMKPFQDAGVELDIIQLAPLSIYNFVSYDILGEQLSAEDYDPDNPPPSLVVLSMGTDTTDLVITNGFRVWQRSIPLGGNHFTKQLTKELKLTFAKAEHLKRNARQAEDPKTGLPGHAPGVQRPGDGGPAIDRLLPGHRPQGQDRRRRRAGQRGEAAGSAAVPGEEPRLRGQQLRGILRNCRGRPSCPRRPSTTTSCRSASATACACRVWMRPDCSTNLVPREIMTERLVRAKKPWAVATVGALLLACTFNVFFYYGRLHKVLDDRAVAGVDWKQAISQVDQASSLSADYEQADAQLVAQLGRISAIGEELVGNTDRRVVWLEMLKTVNTALPTTPGVQPGEIPDVDKLPFHQRQEIHVDQLEVQYQEKLEDWFSETVKTKYIDQSRSVPSLDTDTSTTPGTTGADTTSTGPAGPTGEGWVVQLQCYHYFNQDMQKQGIAHVLNTLIFNLKNGHVVFPVMINKIQPGVRISQEVPNPQGGPPRFVALHVTALTPVLQPDPNTGVDRISAYQMTLEGVESPMIVPVDGRVPVVFTMKEMGIDYPVVVVDSKINPMSRVPNPNFTPPETGYPGGSGGTGAAGRLGGMMGGGVGGAGGAGMLGPPGVGGAGGAGMLGPPGAGGAGGAGLLGPPGAGGSYPPRGGGSAAGKKEDEEPQEPPFLTVPRYDFTVHFIWTEKLLSERLAQQAADWAKQGKQGAQPGGDANLAANLKGGA